MPGNFVFFSPWELLEYGRSVYADDSKYKTWHEQAIKAKKQKKWKRRIFTYIHQDNYQYQVEN